MNASSPYPETASKRSHWIRNLRKKIKRPTESSIPHTLLETEPALDGSPIQTGTIFLINRECPWTCVMCDLWQNTTTRQLPPGYVTQQIKQAISKLRSESNIPIRQIKVYNSGSFFDLGAIPSDEYTAIAKLLDEFDRVIVECHPKLIGDQTTAFARMLKPKLEIAMGLESASDDILQRLNKRFTMADYRSACSILSDHSIDHRAFVMIQPPFVRPDQTLDLCLTTLEVAFDYGAVCASLIPTRITTGAMRSLQQTGDLHPLSLEQVESCFEAALDLKKRGQVWVDTWDLHHIRSCSSCFETRRARIEKMNATQSKLPKSVCASCQTS